MATKTKLATATAAALRPDDSAIGAYTSIAKKSAGLVESAKACTYAVVNGLATSLINVVLKATRSGDKSVQTVANAPEVFKKYLDWLNDSTIPFFLREPIGLYLDMVLPIGAWSDSGLFCWGQEDEIVLDEWRDIQRENDSLWAKGYPNILKLAENVPANYARPARYVAPKTAEESKPETKPETKPAKEITPISLIEKLINSAKRRGGAKGADPATVAGFKEIENIGQFAFTHLDLVSLLTKLDAAGLDSVARAAKSAERIAIQREINELGKKLSS